MQVNAITSYQYSTPNKLNNHQKQSTPIESNSVNFTAREDNRRNSNAMRNAVVALCFLPVAGGVVTSCDKEAFAEAKVNVDANANANANASIIKMIQQQIEILSTTRELVNGNITQKKLVI